MFLCHLTLFESLKVVLIKMVTILTMSAKFSTLGLLKLNVTWNKGYDITNKTLSHYPKSYCKCGHITKFGNFSIFMTQVIITSILQGFYQKKQFFERCSRLKFNNLELALGITLKFYTSVVKRLKLFKSENFGVLFLCV